MNPIVQETTMKASAERIFAAITDPEERTKWWWGAKGVFEITQMESDLRPGGKWAMRGLGPGGRSLTVEGEYQTIDPPRLLVYTWRPDWHGEVTETLVSWELIEEGQGLTRVRLTHSGFTTETYRSTYRGWPQILAGLQRHVEDPDLP